MSSTINTKGSIGEIKIEKKSTIKEILREHNLPQAEYIILVNGELVSENTEVSPKDTIMILPKVRGG